MSLFKFFRGAGAAGMVFLLNNGERKNKGLAYSGILGPYTTVAVVPTVSRIIPFSVSTRSKDEQAVTVTGELEITLDPDTVVSKFDFTVNNSGGYTGDWEEALRSLVIAQILKPVHTKAGELDVKDAVKSMAVFETTIVSSGASTQKDLLAEKGIKLVSASVKKVEADDAELSRALGATEKQGLLTTADAAVHGRRSKAAENDRSLKQYEAQTVQALEEDRKKLIEFQITNDKLKADADVENQQKRLALYKDIEPGKLLAVSLMDFAGNGNVGTLNIGPELLTAIQGITKE